MPLLTPQYCRCKVCQQYQMPVKPLPLTKGFSHIFQNSAWLNFLSLFAKGQKPIPITIMDTYFLKKGVTIYTALNNTIPNKDEVALSKVFKQLTKRRMALSKEQMVLKYKTQNPGFIVSEFDLDSIYLLKNIEADLAAMKKVPGAFGKQAGIQSFIMTDQQLESLCYRRYNSSFDPNKAEYLQLFPFTGPFSEKAQFIVIHYQRQLDGVLMEKASYFLSNWMIQSQTLEMEEQSFLKRLDDKELLSFKICKLVLYIEQQYLIRVKHGYFQFFGLREYQFFLKDVFSLDLQNIQPAIEQGQNLSRQARQILARQDFDQSHSIPQEPSDPLFHAKVSNFMQDHLDMLERDYFRFFRQTLDNITNTSDMKVSEEVYERLTGRAGLHSYLRGQDEKNGLK